jgi:predicted short-subunit dehydrogenase-like oxidoreductase (DUF2520 family)
MQQSLRNRRENSIGRKTFRAETRASSPALPSVTLIGCGNWGTALALALRQAGISLREIVRSDRPHAEDRSRSRPSRAFATSVAAKLTTIAAAGLDADVLWICTPDSAIATVAKQLADALTQAARTTPSSRPVVFHSSGALPSTELAPLQALGISAGSVHPLMTFPRRARSTQAPFPLTGIPFAIEGDLRACRAARRIVRALEGEAFELSAENKPLYHAFGAFTSPLLIALLTAGMETGLAAGCTSQQARRRMRPIVERTVSNFFTNGPQESFSGPIARGDATTVERHLQALGPYPPLLSIYRELALFAVGSLPAKNKKAIRQLLRNVACPVNIGRKSGIQNNIGSE